MASEEDFTESGTSSPAASTSQVSRAARSRVSENLRCPICLDAINDRASVSWRRHPFCFYCMVEWWHRKVEGLAGQSPFPHTFHTVGDNNSEVYSIGESSSARHTQGERAGSRSEERQQHRSSGRQHRKSCSRSCAGSRGGSRGGRAQEKSRSRYPRQHHDSCGRVHQAQGHNSSSRRRRQSRAQNTARAKGRPPRRLKRRQQEYQVSFIEPRVVRSRSRQRSRSTDSQTLREYLRKMERDEGRALRQDWYIRASLGRSRRQQQRRQASYREPQRTARSRTLRRLRSTVTLKENPRRMEHYERQPLRIDQDIHASLRRSERLQQGRQVSSIEPQLTRSQTRGRSRSTRHQTAWENLRRMECDEGRALRPKRDIPTSSGWNERRQQGRQVGFTEPQVARN